MWTLRTNSVGSMTVVGRVVGSVLVVALLASVVAFVAGSVGLGQAGAQVSTAEVTRVVSCLAGNGRVDSTIVNTTAAAATYRVEFEGLSPRQATVAAGDWIRLPLTGRADGDYLVRTLRDGQVISAETVTVACDESPRTTGDEVTPIVACRGGNGYVLVQLVNNSADPKPYVVQFDRLRNRSTTAAPYGAGIKSITGRPDGTYTLTVISGSQIVATVPVTVSCDTPPAEAVANPTQCLSDGARISYVVSNNTSAAITAVLEVDGVIAATGPVSMGSPLTLARRGLDDGVYAVKVTLGGAVVIDEQVEVQCDGPFAEPDFATVDEGDAVAIDLLTNDDGLGLELTVTGIDTTDTVGTVELSPNYGSAGAGTVLYTASGAGLVEGEQLIDTFAYTVVDALGDVATGLVTVTVTGVNASPEILGPAQPISVPENTTAVATATASDADDPAGSLIWSLDGGPDAWLLTIDPMTGQLEFLTPPDAEDPLDVGADNTYEILIAVADDQGATDSLAVEIVVTDVASNASRRIAGQIFDDVVFDFIASDGIEPSMALNAAGHPTLSFTDGDNLFMKVLRCDDPLCEGDAPTTPPVFSIVDGETEIAIGPSGNPTVAFMNFFGLPPLPCLLPFRRGSGNIHARLVHGGRLAGDLPSRWE